MAEIPRGEVNTIAKNIFLSLAILSFSLCNSCHYLMFLHWSRTGRCYHEEKYLFVLGNYVPSVGILCTTDSPFLHMSLSPSWTTLYTSLFSNPSILPLLCLSQFFPCPFFLPFLNLLHNSVYTSSLNFLLQKSCLLLLDLPHLAGLLYWMICIMIFSSSIFTCCRIWSHSLKQVFLGPHSPLISIYSIF